ncbi:MAG: type I phosphomannose isomerase catalytic subunit [Acutalibacteraceae bacterium]|nr:class I mannose-6-phosphate isomerase [Oscillospiraceae bacterium]
MYAMKLTAPLKDYIWGGTRLSREWGFTSFADRQAEAWVLSCHCDGESVVENGEHSGKTLREVLSGHPEYVGSNAGNNGQIPVLIKLIDAADNLSVQVHPDEEYAMKNEGDHGKTEAWYVLDCEEGAEIIYGFKKDVTKEEFEEAVRDNKLTDLVNRVKVKKGDVFFIKAGTLHAICRGIMIFEVQQSSNVTYRVYDYGRLQNGKPRQLHIEKALDVTDRRRSQVSQANNQTTDHGSYSQTQLVACDIFTLSRLDVRTEAPVEADESSFMSLVCVDGNGVLMAGDDAVTLYKGDSLFLPAGMGKCKILGKVCVLQTKIP